MPNHVRVEDSPCRRVAGFLDRRQQAATGVVDHHIDAAEPLHGRFDRRGGLRLVQHVESHRQELVTRVGKPRSDGTGVAGGRDN